MKFKVSDFRRFNELSKKLNPKLKNTPEWNEFNTLSKKLTPFLNAMGKKNIKILSDSIEVVEEIKKMKQNQTMNIATFDAIEGSLEIQFCNDDGELVATKDQQIKFLQNEFSQQDIDMYINMYMWDDEGNCIGEA